MAPPSASLDATASSGCERGLCCYLCSPAQSIPGGVGVLADAMLLQHINYFHLAYAPCQLRDRNSDSGNDSATPELHALIDHKYAAADDRRCDTQNSKNPSTTRSQYLDAMSSSLSLTNRLCSVKKLDLALQIVSLEKTHLPTTTANVQSDEMHRPHTDEPECSSTDQQQKSTVTTESEKKNDGEKQSQIEPTVIREESNGDEPLMCQLCKINLTNGPALMQHVQKHEEEMRLKSKRIATRALYKRCFPTCAFPPESADGSQAKKSRKHKAKSTALNHEIALEQLLQQHWKRNKEFNSSTNCGICQEKLNTADCTKDGQWRLLEHTFVHFRDALFVCAHCNYRSPLLSSVQWHMTTEHRSLSHLESKAQDLRCNYDEILEGLVKRVLKID